MCAINIIIIILSVVSTDLLACGRRCRGSGGFAEEDERRIGRHLIFARIPLPRHELHVRHRHDTYYNIRFRFTWTWREMAAAMRSVCRVLARSGPNPAAASTAPALTTSRRDCEYFSPSIKQLFRRPACLIWPANLETNIDSTFTWDTGLCQFIKIAPILSGNRLFFPGRRN